MKRMSVFSLCAVAVLAGLLAVCGAGEAAPAKQKMSIATASIGGAYYPVGTGIANLINKYVPAVEVRVEVTGGGMDNARLVGSGESDLGLSNASQVSMAIDGKKPFAKKYPLRVIAHVYPSVYHMVTRENSPYRSLEDLKGRRVAVGPAGGGTYMFLRELAAVSGLDIKDFKLSYISYNDGVLALQDGNVDANFALAGAPTAAIMELATRTPLRHISMKEDVLQKFLARHSYHIRFVIPKDMYKTKEDGVTFAGGNLLVVNQGMSADMAYKITAALYNHLEELRAVHPSTKGVTLDLAPQTSSPLHPGAERYYREKGLLKK